jgi:hypothetical protein
MKKETKNTFLAFERWFSKSFKLFENQISGEVSWASRSRPHQRFLDAKNTLFFKAIKKYPTLQKGHFVATLRNSKKQPTNVLHSYLSAAAADAPKTDPFARLFSYITSTPEAGDFAGALKKHYLRAIDCLYTGKPNKQIFTMVSLRQSVGKTTLISWLFPQSLNQYTMCTLAGRKDKRDVILATKFLVNIDEFSGAKKTSDEQLKAMTAQNTAALYVPFKNEIEHRPRITSFFATRNYTGEGFLNDATGSSRYVIFDVEEIDFEYSKDIQPDDLWAYAAAAYANGERGDLSPAELAANENYNAQFLIAEPPKKRRQPQTRTPKNELVKAAAASSAGAAFTAAGIYAVKYFVYR